MCLGKKGLRWHDCFSNAKLGKEERKSGESGEHDQIAMLKVERGEVA